MRLAILTLFLARLVLSLQEDYCTNLNPIWTVTNVSVSIGLEVRTGGSIAFKINSSATNKTESLSGSLRANSRCEIAGTPSDKAMNIKLQTLSGALYVTINETLHCSDAKV